MKPETLLQIQIVEYLSLHGVFFYAPLNETAMMIMTMFKVPVNIRAKIINYLKKLGLLPGNPDLHILHNKTVYFMEVKTDKTDLTGSQPMIHERLISMGYNVCTVHNFDEAVRELKMAGIVK